MIFPKHKIDKVDYFEVVRNKSSTRTEIRIYWRLTRFQRFANALNQNIGETFPIETRYQFDEKDTDGSMLDFQMFHRQLIEFCLDTYIDPKDTDPKNKKPIVRPAWQDDVFRINEGTGNDTTST